MRWLKWLWRDLVYTLSNEDGFSGRKDREKEAKRQEDVARQREAAQTDLNQFLSQLPTGSEERARLQSEGSDILSRIGDPGDQAAEIRALGADLVQSFNTRVAAGEPATALEARTQAAFGGLREAAERTPDEEDIFRILRGEEPTTEIGRLFKERIITEPGQGLESELERALRGEDTTTPLGGIAGDIISTAQEEPESVFEDELSLLQDRINREANVRGLASSGIPIEQLGRAGVELAIQQALRREDVRRTRQGDVLDLLDRAKRGDQQAIQNLSALFETGQTLRGREIGVEEAFTNLQLGRESNLTDLLSRQSSDASGRLLDLLASQTTRAEGQRDVASALREGERQRLESFLFPEVTIGAGSAKAKFGGGGQATFSQASQPATTGRAPSGAPAGSDVGSLLAAERTQPSARQTPIDLSGRLSRRRAQSGGVTDELTQTLARILGSG